ncbi:MAG: BrnT family toxin [Opitutae bacterium]|jgi:hypothetical protein|nr:BrnT family toxin [Opitutae bacterium]|tara:strand:- start:170 stop:439 length:270 start_codon:yes stop_codon:yes gene_type:complete
MDFEFDPKKSEKNKGKHGIDFKEGQALWNDPNALVFRVRVEGEPRFALLAKHGNKAWTAIYTVRSDRIRIISIRRSRKKEEMLYESGRI